jgi:hypothetical protein
MLFLEQRCRARRIAARKCQAGINLVVAAGFIVLAIVLGVGLMMSSNHTSLSSISSLFSMQGAGGAMSDMDGVTSGFATVVQNGTSIQQVSFNGVATTSYVVPSTNGIACLSAAGSIDTTAGDCSTVRANTITGYASQVFSPQGGGANPPTPNSANTNSTQQYYFTTWRIEDGSGNDLGTSTPEVVMVLLDAKQGVCEQVNSSLWGDNKNVSTIPVSAVATNAGLVASGSPVVVTSIGVGPRDKGCVSTADNKYVLFEVLAAQ